MLVHDTKEVRPDQVIPLDEDFLAGAIINESTRRDPLFTIRHLWVMNLRGRVIPVMMGMESMSEGTNNVIWER